MSKLDFGPDHPKYGAPYKVGMKTVLERNKNILNAPGAAARPDFARALAVETTLSVEDATRVLAVVSGKGMFAHLDTDTARAGLAEWQRQQGAAEPVRQVGATDAKDTDAVVEMARAGLPHLFGRK